MVKSKRILARMLEKLQPGSTVWPLMSTLMRSMIVSMCLGKQEVAPLGAAEVSPLKCMAKVRRSTLVFSGSVTETSEPGRAEELERGMSSSAWRW